METRNASVAVIGGNLLPFSFPAVQRKKITAAFGPPHPPALAGEVKLTLPQRLDLSR